MMLTFWQKTYNSELSYQSASAICVYGDVVACAGLTTYMMFDIRGAQVP